MGRVHDMESPRTEPARASEDDGFPVGTAPPGRRWLLVVALLAWAGFLVFMIELLVTGGSSPPSTG